MSHLLWCSHGGRGVLAMVLLPRCSAGIRDPSMSWELCLMGMNHLTPSLVWVLVQVTGSSGLKGSL